ncbi:saga-like transcriptional regulatory complex subunit spt3 [Colletotrichum musicola]|uniref:Saga-like transcriptional regulatory complex subunit spt3 n=1 Tax=Colletotrichum musicola TaxID=2175873 RepID=A0A8H6NLI7_9PEZI|nr:saga-like transcriptional regulatory complex subunit spt3 [Colletotrichum musicola]
MDQQSPFAPPDDRPDVGCSLTALTGCLRMSVGILEQLTEDDDGGENSEPITGTPKPARPSRAAKAVASRIQRESIELFQSAFDQAVGVVHPSGYKSIYDIPVTAEERASLRKPRGKRPRGKKTEEPSMKAQPRVGGKLRHGFHDRLTDLLKKMMYVSGETAEPSVETTSIIEDIVRQQVIELLRNCTDLAARRGSRSITINDLIFQIRHDQAKVSRLRTFLSWKDVRKNVKDSDDKGGEADIGAGEDPGGGVVPGGPVDDAAKKNKKAKVGLLWEPSSFYSQEVPERDDEEDEEEEEMNFITLQRLRKADERTKAMTREEYVTWSEYRQASFTYRKGKRFREWAGFGIVTDSKPSDDIVDILGFLTFEMVQTLTEHALKVKEQEDLFKALNGGDNAGSKKRKVATGLFDPPSEGRSPIEPRHVQEAFRRLQQRPKKTRAMLNGTRLPQHTALNIVS